MRIGYQKLCVNNSSFRTRAREGWKRKEKILNKKLREKNKGLERTITNCQRKGHSEGMELTT